MFKNHWLWFYKILENQFEECRNLATKKIGINSFWIRNCFVMISSSKKSLKTIIFRDLDQYTIFLCFKICDFSNLDWGKLAIPDIWVTWKNIIKMEKKIIKTKKPFFIIFFFWEPHVKSYSLPSLNHSWYFMSKPKTTTSTTWNEENVMWFWQLNMVRKNHARHGPTSIIFKGQF